MGGMGQSGRNNPEEIVKEIARRLCANGTWLNAPAIVGSLETRDMLMNDDGVRAVFDKASRCTKCLLGLGDIDGTASLRIAGFLSEDALAELKSKGAVGDILGRFFDVNGQDVQSSISDRTMSLPIDVIKQTPERIAFVTGLYKTEPIVGAARGEIINALVTDEETADRVLKYLDEQRA
jgi:DNA-binding transcriptional regulator LsrR (DeoR family)